MVEHRWLRAVIFTPIYKFDLKILVRSKDSNNDRINSSYVGIGSTPGTSSLGSLAPVNHASIRELGSIAPVSSVFILTLCGRHRK